MKKDINFYIECLKREFNKPLNKQDFMYMRHLDEIINNLKIKSMKHKESTNKQVLEWYDNFVDYVMQYDSNVYNSACEYADAIEQER